MQKILVPTDFSENAFSALLYATQLYHGEACTFYLLNVYNAFTPLAQPQVASLPAMQQLADESNEGLMKTLVQIKLEGKGAAHSFVALSKFGELAAQVQATLTELGADAVVIGNTGCSELEAIFFGSNALHIIGKINACPVLTIPKKQAYKNIRSLVFVTDFSRPYDAGTLRPLVELAKKFECKIRVLHVKETAELSRVQDINLGVLMEYLKPYHVSAHAMPLYKSKVTAINQFMKELETDLLVMVNYGHGTFHDLIREPMIKRLTFDPILPVLILPG